MKLKSLEDTKKFSENISDIIKSQRHGRSLWKLFLIIAIMLFLFESLISRPIKEQIKH